MTSHNDDLVDIELTNTERELMVQVLNEYAGTAQQAFELMAPVVGQTSEDEWWDYIGPLHDAIKRKQPLSDLDWARALFLTEVGFASDLVGSGRRFGRRADEFWIVELRSLQDKITDYRRYTLLRDNAAYPPATRSPSSSDTPGMSHF
ncbi:MAG: hypothetical protein WAM92_16950 [Mycobacterium sp.]